MPFKKTGQKTPKADTEIKQQSPKVETTPKKPESTKEKEGQPKEEKRDG